MVTINWVWDTEVAGTYINIDGTSFGPMKYSDIWNLPAWLTKAALRESDHDEQQRMVAAYRKVCDLSRADWLRLLAKADILNKHTNMRERMRTSI